MLRTTQECRGNFVLHPSNEGKDRLQEQYPVES